MLCNVIHVIAWSALNCLSPSIYIKQLFAPSTKISLHVNEPHAKAPIPCGAASPIPVYLAQEGLTRRMRLGQVISLH